MHLPRPKTLCLRRFHTEGEDKLDPYWVNTCPYCSRSIGDSYLYGRSYGPFHEFFCGPDTAEAFEHDLSELAWDIAERSQARRDRGQIFLHSKDRIPDPQSGVSTLLPILFRETQTIVLPPNTYNALEAAMQQQRCDTSVPDGVMWTHMFHFSDEYAIHAQILNSEGGPYLDIVLFDSNGREILYADPGYSLVGTTTMIGTKNGGEYHHIVSIVRGLETNPEKAEFVGIPAPATDTP
jgi:hypothetical protein